MAKAQLDEMFPVDDSSAELRKAVAELRRALPILAEVSDELAAARFALFTSLKDAGFTEHQALTLCTDPSGLNSTATSFQLPEVGS